MDRSLITGNQVITVTPSAAQTLGFDLPASGVIPAHQKVNFLFGKTDYQINAANRLSARYFLFKNFSLSNIAGGLTTTDRATDFTDRMDSASAQLISTIGSDKLNELRVQYARRHQFRTLSDTAADGPAITVTGVANFGGPRIGDTNSVGFDFNQGIWQVIDNLTWIRGRHSFKAGIDAQFIADDRVRGERFFYTFPTNDAYLGGAERRDAASATPRCSRISAIWRRRYNSAFYGFFVQDDWQLNSRMKLLYGIRYDLFDVPSARAFAPESVLAGLHDRQEQLRPARRLLVVARRQRHDRAARLDGADVRTAAHRLLRQRDPEQRRSAGLHRQRVRHGGWRARRSRPASRTCPPASCCRGRASRPSTAISRRSTRG